MTKTGRRDEILIFDELWQKWQNLWFVANFSTKFALFDTRKMAPSFGGKIWWRSRESIKS